MLLNEKPATVVIDHILIRDKDSGEVLVNKRGNMPTPMNLEPKKEENND